MFILWRYIGIIEGIISFTFKHNIIFRHIQTTIYFFHEICTISRVNGYILWRFHIREQSKQWRNRREWEWEAGGRMLSPPPPPPETSDWEISAYLPGKREARKKGKMEEKRRKIKKGKVENWKWKEEKLQNVERTFFYFFFQFFIFVFIFIFIFYFIIFSFLFHFFISFFHFISFHFISFHFISFYLFYFILFFIIFFFCIFYFLLLFSKPLKFVLGLPKWKFSTGKRHFMLGIKSGKMTFPPLKNISLTPLQSSKLNLLYYCVLEMKVFNHFFKLV